MIGAIGSAMTGLASATSRFDRASERIARPQDPANGDRLGDRVEQITAQHAFAANLATIRTADDMVGTLINTVA